MKHKVAELEGALLDAAVAKAEGWREVDGEWRSAPTADDELGDLQAMAHPVDVLAELIPDADPAQLAEARELCDSAWAPSSNWADGGPIIERERITLMSEFEVEHGWLAFVGYVGTSTIDMTPPDGDGRTPLIAAMRAYVASKFGAEVELP